MSRPTSVLLLWLLIGLSACEANVSRRENKSKVTELPDSVALAANQKSQRNEKLEAATACVRGQAEPIVNKKYFPTATFVLQPDSLSAVETVSFANGDKLLITNSGCEYYVLTFRFETSRFKADTSNLSYWYAVGTKLLTEMGHALNAPLNIRKGTQVLAKRLTKKAVRLKPHTEIDFGGSEIRDFVTLGDVTKIHRGRYAITISFATGPL